MPPPFGAKTTADEAVQHFAPQIKGKVILITGVSPNSLGACFVQAIAKAQPKLLILAGRNAAKAEETARSIDSGGNGVSTRVLTLDLSSQQQVRDAAATVNNYEESIDVLVNNAGIMASDYFTTVDGIEGQFGTNHIGPWLFTNLVIGKILSSPGGGRVVNVSSNGYRLSGVRFHDYNFHVTQHPARSRQSCDGLLTRSIGRGNIQQVAKLRAGKNSQYAHCFSPR